MSVADDHIQEHDVQVLIKGATIPVYLDDTMTARGSDGWRGGQWVQYVATSFGPDNNVKNIRVVAKSTGEYAVGFLLRGSEFHPQVQQPGGSNLRISEYNYSSYQPKNTAVATMCLDGSYLTISYERYAFPNRDSGVAMVYTLSEDLYVSERGLLTTYADAIAAGIAAPVWAGKCCLTPSDESQDRIGIDRF